ncbi:MAG: Murein DD-endopeptidase MepM [Elusimicrobia bacterium]|nr:Murein DD-endopeptidase MepM [Elusimicrobiota bacterium]
MNSSPISPRQRVALILGSVSLILLIALLLPKKAKHFFSPAPPPVVITTGTVQSGDVFGLLLTRHGKLDPKYVAPVQKAFREQFRPESIQPGHHFEIVTSTTGIFQKLTYKIDPTQSFVVTRSSGDVYQSEQVTQKTVWMEKRISVEVTKFLEWDLRNAGYEPTLIDNLTYELGESIFGWRIDFFTEQRKGDRLDVLLEEEYIVGEDHPIKGGKHMRVITASYTGSGTKNKENVAIRFQSHDAKRADYFDPEGKAMRREFLRAPFTKGVFRISSGFNPRRLHPILRVYRPHHGTDYAASVGTPVAAIGKGTVVRAEWYKGYGNCIDIRHNNRYVSRYGHLSKIAVRRGQVVEQGRYIGKVGNTGLSTGPHLHFEMLVNGAQQNFLRMNFPASSSVAKSDMPDFYRVRDEALARLAARPVDQPKKLS